MAEQKPPTGAGKPVKFPANWSKMTKAQRQEWQEKNRPGYNAAARAAKPPTPAPKEEAPPVDYDQDWDGEGAAQGAAQGADQGAAKEGETLNVELQLPPAKEGMRSPRETVAELLRDLADMLKPRTE